MFNLPSPPGFRGLDEHLPISMYQRNLPHWRQDGSTYFVTFRLEDALPQTVIKQLKELRRIWELNNPEPRCQQTWETLAREIVVHTERSLDQGFGACHFRNAEFANVLAKSLVRFHGERYATNAYVIMPNHCHMVMQPFAGFELETILQGIKGFVAREINRALAQSKTVWQEESYDRIIRDLEHHYRVIQYIGRNPELAGIPRSGWIRWMDPEWRRAGWMFEDEMPPEIRKARS
jgi:putative transposase